METYQSIALFALMSKDVMAAKKRSGTLAAERLKPSFDPTITMKPHPLSFTLGFEPGGATVSVRTGL